MIVDFEVAKTANSTRRAQEKTRYIITIGEDEEPGFAAAELQEGTTTVMITARTPEEAAVLWKQSEAARRMAH